MGVIGILIGNEVFGGSVLFSIVFDQTIQPYVRAELEMLFRPLAQKKMLKIGLNTFNEF